MKHYIGVSLVLIVLAVIAAYFLYEVRQTTREAAEALRNAVASTLRVQPEVRVNQTVIYGQTAPVAELAVVSQEELVSLNQKEKQQIWGFDVPFTGTETNIGATFRVKAGFELDDRFVVNLNATTGDVAVSLPPAKILSVEMVGRLSWQETENWLNSITPEERQEALNQLMASARTAALSSGILEQAETEAQRRLRDVLQHAAPGRISLQVRDQEGLPQP